MTAPDLPEGARWTTVRPGDTVIITLPDATPYDDIQRLMDTWIEQLPDTPMMVITDVTHMAVVQGPGTQAAQGCCGARDKITPESKADTPD